MSHRTQVRRYRKHWALSQDDLSYLLGISQSALSRSEGGDCPPEFETVVGLQVVFNRSPRALFSRAYDAVEELVMARAAEMDLALEGKADRRSLRNRELLETMSARARSFADAV